MKLFKGLERLDVLQSDLTGSFEYNYAEHEKSVLSCLNTVFGVSFLEAMMCELAEYFLDAPIFTLTDAQLSKLIQVRQEARNKHEVYLFRAYLFGKRAKEIYDDLNQPDKRFAFSYLYHAGIAPGQCLAEVDKISKSIEAKERGKPRIKNDWIVHEKLIELIRERRPAEGWKTMADMAASLADELYPCIEKNRMPIKPENTEKAIRRWVRAHPAIKVSVRPPHLF